MGNAFHHRCNEGYCKDDEGTYRKDNELFHSQDHQCKGRMDQFKDSSHRKDGIRIQKQGAPEDYHIFQVR